jgi:hypothetical protein
MKITVVPQTAVQISLYADIHTIIISNDIVTCLTEGRRYYATL